MHKVEVDQSYLLSSLNFLTLFRNTITASMDQIENEQEKQAVTFVLKTLETHIEKTDQFLSKEGETA